EGILAGDNRLMAQLIHPREAALDRLEETLLLGAGDALDVLLLRHDLRIHLAHHGRDRASELGEGRLAPSQEPGVTHGAAENSSQHVAAPLVRRIDPIAQEKRDGARVVGEDAVRRAGWAAVVWPSDDLDRLGNDRLK